MSQPKMTEALARAIAADTATRQMIQQGRKRWAEEDFNLAVETFDKLWSMSEAGSTHE